MIELKIEHGRVWMVINGNRVGLLPSQATELATRLREAAWRLKVEAGEVVDAEFVAGEV